MTLVLTAPEGKNYDVDLDGDETMLVSSPSHSSDSFASSSVVEDGVKKEVDSGLYKERHGVWERDLLEFFPAEKKQPKETLGELVLRSWNGR